jgi:hypothetical protein
MDRFSAITIVFPDMSAPADDPAGFEQSQNPVWLIWLR